MSLKTPINKYPREGISCKHIFIMKMRIFKGVWDTKISRNTRFCFFVLEDNFKLIYL